MNYNEFMNRINTQLKKVKTCKGYEGFKEDVEKLKIDNTGCGLCAITANVWLHQICELTDEALTEYVNKYKKGTLNAWQCY